MICNKCGKMIQTSGIHREEYLEVTKTWGYFSQKDGEKQHWILCEDCYDELIDSFVKKVEVEEELELL